MVVRCLVKKNLYYDSVILMTISSELSKSEGVNNAAVMMGTDQNKLSIAKMNLLTEEVQAAAADDLFISVESEDEEVAEAAIKKAEQLLSSSLEDVKEIPIAYSLESALKKLPGANILLISIPGSHVESVAMEALENNLNLHIFSDNVPLEVEAKIKEEADKKNLLVMGPDCGTAIINGVPLGFANQVRKGSIGIVGASGTGIQEISTLVHRLGEGVSHAIGTGSNDLNQAIGGKSMIAVLQLLDKNPDTEIIVLVSKPPAVPVAEKVLQVAAQCSKPVVVNFVGPQKDFNNLLSHQCQRAKTLEEAAYRAVGILRGVDWQNIKTQLYDQDKILVEETAGATEGSFIRAIYSGGTFAAEAVALMTEQVTPVFSNTNVEGSTPMEKERTGHLCVDMGADEFTVGRPHPMIDPSLQAEWIERAVSEPTTAAIVFDVVLGHGVHPDPAGFIADKIKGALARVQGKDRKVPIFCFVCGVEEDMQVRSKQVEKLRQTGCFVYPSNNAAVMGALELLKKIKK